MSSLYTTFEDMYDDIEENRKEGKKREAMRRYIRPELLVIDATEVRGNTPAEYRVIDNNIDKRYRDLLDTIIITNEKSEAFFEAVGESIKSRFDEIGLIITCNWGSFRK